MKRALLGLTAFLFAFFGLWATLSPEGMVSLIGLRAEGVDAVADIRGMYGGLELAIGGILGWHLLDEDRHSQGLVFGGVFLGCLGGLRLLSLLLTSFTLLSTGLVCAELGGALACLWLGWQS